TLETVVKNGVTGFWPVSADELLYLTGSALYRGSRAASSPQRRRQRYAEQAIVRRRLVAAHARSDAPGGGDLARRRHRRIDPALVGVRRRRIELEHDEQARGRGGAEDAAVPLCVRVEVIAVGAGVGAIAAGLVGGVW